MATEDTEPSPELPGPCRAEQGLFDHPGTAGAREQQETLYSTTAMMCGL